MYFLLLTLNFLGPNPFVVPETTPEAPSSLFASTDAGQSWQALEEGLPERVVPRDIFEHECHLYLTTSNAGLYRMNLQEEEKRWESSSLGLPPETSITDIVANGDLMVLNAYWRGIYISKDGGENWRRPIFNLSGQVQALYFDNNRLLAASDRGIFESWNGGESWQLKWDIYRVHGLTRYKGQLVAARQNTIGFIQNDTAKWVDIRTDWAIIDLLPYGDYLYARAGKGTVLRSEDGLTWEKNPEKSWQHPPLASSLPEALWKRLDLKLPGERPIGFITDSSIGWIATVNTGC